MMIFKMVSCYVVASIIVIYSIYQFSRPLRMKEKTAVAAIKAAMGTWIIYFVFSLFREAFDFIDNFIQSDNFLPSALLCFFILFLIHKQFDKNLYLKPLAEGQEEEIMDDMLIKGRQPSTTNKKPDES